MPDRAGIKPRIFVRRMGQPDPEKEWYGVVEEAQDMVCEDAEVQIQGYDIDDEVLKMARANAALAGVEDKIHFQRRDIINFSSPKNTVLSFPIRRTANVFLTKTDGNAIPQHRSDHQRKMIRGHFSC